MYITVHRLCKAFRKYSMCIFFQYLEMRSISNIYSNT